MPSPCLAFAVLLLAFAAQNPSILHSSSRLQEVRQLYARHDWQGVVQATPPRPGDPAEVDYYRGMALAKLKRWSEARQAFLRGRRKAPRDKRFPTELGGVAFVQKNYAEAKRELRATLRLDPHDRYALDFMATIYELEDNTAAALKYWNRAGMPEVQKITFTPTPQLDPVLLNGAIAFSRGAVLTLPAWRTTQARLGALGVFTQPRLGVQPLTGGGYGVQLTSIERNGWGNSKLQGLVSLLRGAPYETIYPEFFNLGQSAMNFTSLLRWDPNKERVFTSFSSPIESSAEWRYELYLDGRRENWNLSNTFFGAAAPVNDMRLEKVEGGARVESVVSGRLQWNMGVDLSGRSFSNVHPATPSAASFFRNGFALEYRAGAGSRIIDLPEHRFSVDAGATSQAGRMWLRGANPFLQAEGSLRAHWLPQAQGNDYEMNFQARAGKTWGAVPFDDLFILGIERDNDLWLRAHVGTADGKKGSAPLGRNYSLFNWDDFKRIYTNGFFNLSAGPFLDWGRISDPSGDFGSRRWLMDTGIELKIGVLGGATVELVFGKDLRTGANAFYATSLGIDSLSH
ncbi:MAG: hypothetical protein ACRD1N_05015 [Terriglobia bacterium]